VCHGGTYKVALIIITGNVVTGLRSVVDVYSSHDEHDTTPPTGMWFWTVDLGHHVNIWLQGLVTICSHDVCDVAEGWARRTSNCVLHVPVTTCHGFTPQLWLDMHSTSRRITSISMHKYMMLICMQLLIMFVYRPYCLLFGTFVP
jgi:hypothetical protein